MAVDIYSAWKLVTEADGASRTVSITTVFGPDAESRQERRQKYISTGIFTG
jgi:hypothetical protein